MKIITGLIIGTLTTYSFFMTAGGLRAVEEMQKAQMELNNLKKES